MAYENDFSQVPNMKGIALDFPFCRFRYVKIQGDQNNQVQPESKVRTAPPVTREYSSPRAMTVSYTRPAEMTTLGIDPMVSYASVIHELSFGRIEGHSGVPRAETTYPVSRQPDRHYLDIIV